MPASKALDSRLWISDINPKTKAIRYFTSKMEEQRTAIEDKQALAKPQACSENNARNTLSQEEDRTALCRRPLGGNWESHVPGLLIG